MKFIKKLVRNEKGATAIEYGLIVAMIAMAIIGAVKSVADENNGLWAIVKDNVTTVM